MADALMAALIAVLFVGAVALARFCEHLAARGKA